LEFHVAHAALGGIARLPDPVREGLVRVLARMCKLFDRSHSAAARDFLRTAFPGADANQIEQRVLDAWRHFLRITLETSIFDVRVPHRRIREHFELDLAPEVIALRRSRRGCIVVTGHIGDWEAGSAILPWIGFSPVYAVAKPPRNQPLSVDLQNVRERRGIRMLPRRGAMQHAPAVIRAGGALALLLDQRARKKPVIAPFFGRPARCDRSAGVLLKRLKAPVIVGACYRKAPFSYRLHLPVVLQPEELAGQSPEQIATRINFELEKLIRADPSQYFWLHDRYRNTAALVDEPTEADDE
jgi:KDO2-lipid IV(A) lauroyltransferase